MLNMLYEPFSISFSFVPMLPYADSSYVGAILTDKKKPGYYERFEFKEKKRKFKKSLYLQSDDEPIVDFFFFLKKERESSNCFGGQ